MKQGKLIRRAVSAALAGCMMFTFSAPALAESTDALMQLSMTRRSAVSVLDAENGDTANYGFTIDLNGTTKTVDESNCKDIFEDKKLSYDPITNKLTNNGTIGGKLTIDAPNVDVELTGNSSVIDGYSTNLNIKNARNVTLSTNSFSVVGGVFGGNAEINCSGKLTIKNSDFTWPAIQGDLTVHNALEILVEGRFSTVVGGNVKIECACPATFKNNQNGGIAKSITYAGDYVYYTSDATDAEAVDPNVTSIPAETAKYVRIEPKMRYNINTAKDATIKLQGQSTELKTAFAGEKVTVTAAGGENAEFTDWTAEGITLTNEQKVNPTVTFTMPGNNVTLTPNYNVVQDYGLEVGSENTTPTRVTSKNCKDILNKGVLSYDPTTQTLKSNGTLPKSLQKINAPGKDINLDGKDQIAVAAKLIVEKARNVKVNSNELAAIMARDDTSTIDCTGEVDISGGFMAVNGSLNIINSSKVNIYTNCAAAVNYDATITSKGDVTIESTDGRAAQKLTINKADNVTVIIKDTQAISENTKIMASGTVILKNTAEGGPVGTVDFTQADGKKYVYYTSEEPDAELIDPRIHPLPDTVESSYLRIEPRETYYSITVANGTAQVGDDTTGLNTAFEGETVTVKAKAPTDEDAAKGVKFHHWKVEEGSTAFTLTDGKLGSKEEAGTEEISFDMPKGDVKLTAVYSIPASVLRSTVTVEGGTAKSTLGEGSDIPAEIGTEVEITATPYDAEKYPGMEFVEWEIKYPDSFYEKFPEGIPENLQLKLDNAKSATTTFKMPVYPVKLIAHWSASPVAKPDPDEPIDEDFGVEPAPMD
ncbi:hypothetical protein, partial [Faecalibacterium sp.]|uniref:InlB B-repeat-containing protein n=1 Tax=Faecalibacterium sp. TaxID=1971605 RepID=UPI0025C2AB0F